MASKDGTSGGSAGLPMGPSAELGPPLAGPNRPDGNPEDIRGLGDWIRRQLGVALGEAIGSLNGARLAAATGWVDDAGNAFTGRLGTLVDRATALEGQLVAAGNEFERAASTLRSGQEQIDEARRIVIEENLMARNGALMTVDSEIRHRRDALQQEAHGMPLDVLERIESEANAKAQAYARARQLGDDAHSAIQDEADRMHQFEVWAKQYGHYGYKAADFSIPGAERHAGKLEHAVGQRVAALDYDVFREEDWVKEFAKHPVLKGLQEQAEANLLEMRQTVATVVGERDAAGLLGRLAKAGGIVVGFEGVAFGLATGESPQEVIFVDMPTMAVGLLGG